MDKAIKYTEAHQAAAGSLAKHLGIECPLPYVVNQVIEWHLKQREDAKLELIERLKNGWYDNRHDSLESVLDIALDGFNISRNKD